MSLLYMKSFRDSDGSRRSNRTGGFGNSFFSKKFSASSLGGNQHQQQQQQQTTQQQQHVHGGPSGGGGFLSRCDSPPGFFDEECPHHTVNRSDLRARSFLRARTNEVVMSRSHCRSSSISNNNRRHHRNSGSIRGTASAPGSADHRPSVPAASLSSCCGNPQQHQQQPFNRQQHGGGGGGYLATSSSGASCCGQHHNCRVPASPSCQQHNLVPSHQGSSSSAVHGRRHQRRSQQQSNTCNSSPSPQFHVCCSAGGSRSPSCARNTNALTSSGAPSQPSSTTGINNPSASSSFGNAAGSKLKLLAATSASIIQHTSRVARRRLESNNDSGDEYGGGSGGGGGGGGGDYVDDYRHVCDDDERATMLQMYNNQSKHAKEKSGGKSVTFRKTGGGGGGHHHHHHGGGGAAGGFANAGTKVISGIMGKGLRHFRDNNSQQHPPNSSSSSYCPAGGDGRQQPHHDVSGAAAAVASAAGSVVVGRRLVCATTTVTTNNNGGGGGVYGAEGVPSSSRMMVNSGGAHHQPGTSFKIGSLSMKDLEGVAETLKGVESLANLTRDCFIIPVEKIGRFLPIGMMTIQHLSANAAALNGTNMIQAIDKRFNHPDACKRLMPPDGSLSSINMVKVDESNLSYVINGLPSAMFPACSSVASGASGRSSDCPAVAQRDGACRLVAKVRMDGKAAHGMLLMSMERSALYPFVSYFVINKLQVNPTELSNKIYEDTSQEFECLDGRHHFVDHFEEVAMITRPPVSFTADRILALDNLAGFIVSIFRVMPGNDGEKFERHWLSWTGARALYRSLPKCVGLRRISLLKSSGARGSVVYLLLVECSNLLENFVQGAQLLPGLRARLCGYTGIYRMIENF